MPTVQYPAPYQRNGHGYAKGWRRMNTSNVVKNNDGTVALGGNVAATGPITSTLISFKEVTGNLVPGPRSRSGTAIVMGSTSLFNNQQVGNYMVKGGSHMSTLANVANTTLNTPTRLSSFNPGIHSLLWRTSRNIASWDLLTGQPTYNTIATVFAYFGTDNAANPTSAVPGRLYYLATGLTPTSDTYKVRYLW